MIGKLLQEPIFFVIILETLLVGIVRVYARIYGRVAQSVRARH